MRCNTHVSTTKAKLMLSKISSEILEQRIISVTISNWCSSYPFIIVYVIWKGFHPVHAVLQIQLNLR